MHLFDVIMINELEIEIISLRNMSYVFLAVFMGKLCIKRVKLSSKNQYQMHQLVVRCKTRISGYANSSKSKIIGANSKNPGCAGVHRCTPSNTAGSAPGCYIYMIRTKKNVS